MPAARDDLPHQVGHRLRARRQALGLTVRGLADAADISPRYVTQAEQGQANLSLLKLQALATALDLPLAAFVSGGPRGAVDGLLAERTPAELAEVAAWLRQRFQPGGCRLIALLGVRGAGKSSVGRRLAARLKRPFVELDAEIARRAELSLAELFALHGEAYYRRLESEALDAVVQASPDAVVATGGSIVTHPENFARLRAAATTVWLRARPEDHWDRVIQQGDRRPMRDHPHAMAELRALLAARAPLYQQADLTVDTAGVSLAAVIEGVSAALAGCRAGG
ncbi:MAG: helix-turn-helix domain-containing protein [Myxococcales bacterium]|nr:helix-turn-helix domain-containing protein [Myxococcales bacterium]MCB9526446.1 helix-turn-helix domain-containing protein [Myxococcales bacterium]